MKKLLTFAVMAVFLATTGLFAQTMVIHANQGNLNEIIMQDTLSDGSLAHSVYQLVTLDTTYKFTGPITIKSNVTIEGVVDPSTGRPPCIQPAVLQDGSIPPTPFTISGANIKVNLKNLYILSKATNNTSNGGGIAVQVSADKVKLTVDNCVFDGWQTFAIGYNGQWDDFFVTNSTFRNLVHPNQWYIGEVIRNEWPGEAYTDSMVFVGNTMLAINGYAACPVTKWYTKYFEFTDNKVLYTFKNPFFIFNLTDGKINGNIFYGNYAGGVDQTENPWWDNLWYPDSSYGIIALQPLSDDNKEMFNPADTSKAESMRRIEVKNNTYFWPQELVDFWTAWNDTASNKIFIPNWMNDRTVAMFNDKTDYPNLVAENNVNKDPGFMSEMDKDILHGTTGNDIGLLNYFVEIRTGKAETDIWGYGITQVGANADWTPAWPLPESSYITAIEEYAGKEIPTAFTLSDVYPNPFNPNASVRYTLDRAGRTSLKVYNILGQQVMTLVNNVYQAANTYKITFNMSRFTSGTYFLVLEQNGRRLVRKMLLLK